MSASDKSYPAFPSDHLAGPQRSGMSLRDYFAAMAMQGMFANPTLPSIGFMREETFDMAYAAADKMLEARK